MRYAAMATIVAFFSPYVALAEGQLTCLDTQTNTSVGIFFECIQSEEEGQQYVWTQNPDIGFFGSSRHSRDSTPTS